MKHAYTYIGLTAGLLLLYASLAPAFADETVLLDRDWSVTAEKPLDKYSPTPQEVGEFITRIQDTNWNVKTCSFRFVDFTKGGSFYLVASTDVTGRHACNQIVVIGKKNGHFSVINEFKAWMVEDIPGAMRDVDNDGIPELVFPETWSDYEGAPHCQAMWGKVYHWKDVRLVDDSAAHPDLYAARMKELEMLIPRTADSSCRQMELDKIKRFLHLSATAGYDRAVEWMKSDDRFLRRKAAVVFADIHDEESLKNLIALTHDPEPLVAESARIDLEKAKRSKE